MTQAYCENNRSTPHFRFPSIIYYVCCILRFQLRSSVPTFSGSKKIYIKIHNKTARKHKALNKVKMKRHSFSANHQSSLTRLIAKSIEFHTDHLKK